MKKLLITGASGLLGINLALTAQARGYDVVGITLEENLQGIPLKMHRLDLTQHNSANTLRLRRRGGCGRNLIHQCLLGQLLCNFS